MFKRNGDVMDRAFDNLEAMAGRLEADPDRPDQFVSGDPAWMYAALTEGEFAVRRRVGGEESHIQFNRWLVQRYRRAWPDGA